MVDVVGIGSDMRGLLGQAAFDDCGQTPSLASALLSAGFLSPHAAKLLGGTYARVLESCLMN